MKFVPMVAALAFAGTITSSCGATGRGETSLTMAAQQSPGASINSAPIIPIYPNSEALGPLAVSITATSPGVSISYNGPLCFGPTAGQLQVGFVQDGALIGFYPITPDRGGCRGYTIPLSGLSTGAVGIYIFDNQGHYDSNYGANYQFTVQKP